MANTLNELMTTIEEKFPLTTSLNFEFFPFCNEIGLENIVEFLRKQSLPLHTGPKVAILFGESRFISLLPELSPLTDVIILADINPLLHLHTLHLLNCLKKANNPIEYIKLYSENNPIQGCQNVLTHSLEKELVKPLSIPFLKD